MKLVQSICTDNPCYKTGQTIKVKGLMLHSVGCNQPKAQVFVNQWSKANPITQVCPHGVIDANDGTVYQTLPWNHRGWHGGGASNSTHIGVEMCEHATIKYSNGGKFTVTNEADAKERVKTAYDSAVELFAYLCQEYKLNPLGDGVIVSHHEGNLRGIASNHGDPEHLWGGVGTSYTMDGFRRDVAKKMGKVKPDKDKTDFKEFVVRVSISNLNLREGAGLSYKSKGMCPKGAYTIIDTKTADGYEWGKLKSGAGWIALKYTTTI